MVGNKVPTYLPPRFHLLNSGPNLMFLNDSMQPYWQSVDQKGQIMVDETRPRLEECLGKLSLIKSSGCPCEDFSTYLGECGFDWQCLSLAWLNHLSFHRLYWVCGTHTMAQTTVATVSTVECECFIFIRNVTWHFLIAPAAYCSIWVSRLNTSAQATCVYGI